MALPCLVRLTSSVRPIPALSGVAVELTSWMKDNPNGAECYGLSASAMVSWIKDFSNTYHSHTGVYPGKERPGPDRCRYLLTHNSIAVIYTTTDWWTTCTGNSAAFASTNPLWIARYSSSIGTLPAGWAYTTFWQYADSGANPGDQDEFNGSMQGLKKYVPQFLS